MVAAFPTFYCTRTLLSYHPSQDLNRITLCGPNDWEFVLYEMGEARDVKAPDRCNALAAKLRELWDK